MVEVGVELARRLLAEQHPDLAGLPLSAAARGWDNVMIRLGDRLAARLPVREQAARLTVDECRALAILAPRLAAAVPEVAVPLPVRQGGPSPALGYGWSWSVVPWIDGVRAAETPVSRRSAWAPTLGRVLRALHVPLPDGAWAPANPWRGVSLQERARPTAEAFLEERLAVVPTRLHDGVARAWRSAVAVAPHEGPPIWLHGDPHPGNLLVRPGAAGVGDELAGVIDFGDVTAGDPASDLGGLWLTFDAAGRAACRAELDPAVDDDAAWQRSAGWALIFATAILREPAADPGLVPSAEHALAELAAAYSGPDSGSASG